MSRLGHRRNGPFEALPGRVLRSVDHAALRPLVDAGSHARILAVMDELSVPVQTVCYECRLRSGDARVDVAVCLFVLRTMGVDDMLGRLGQRHRTDAAWHRCLAFLAEWSHPASPLALQVPFVCVAFDLPGDPEAVPAPALSLCVDREFFARQLGFPVTSGVPASEVLAVVNACHARLRGEPLPAASRALLARCLAGGDGVVARHVSFMLSRTPATCKLDVRLPVESVAPLLRRIDWPGDIPSIAARIRELMPWQGQVQLNLVLHPALGSILEVEILTGRAEVGDDKRMSLLHRLVEAGLCDPTKAEALRDAWSHPVSRRHGLIVARSWYLKVRLEGDRMVEAKAYLGLMPRAWLDRAAAVTPDVPSRSGE